MIGRVVALDQIGGRTAAALIHEGRLDDLLIDGPEDGAPSPGSVFRGIVDRPMKGQGGVFLRLPDGESAFLRNAHVQKATSPPLPPGDGPPMRRPRRSAMRQRPRPLQTARRSETARAATG